MTDKSFFEILVAALVAVLLAGIVYFLPDPSQQKQTSNDRPVLKYAEDSTDAINGDLQGVDLSDVDSEFSDIDRDLNSL